MRDVLMEIYGLLIEDERILKVFEDRIKFYEYPEPESIESPYIVLSEIDEPIPTEYADNDNLALNYLIEVDIFVPESDEYIARELRNRMSYLISRILKENLSFINVSGEPQYDSDLKIYRSVRNYEGTLYRNEIINQWSDET
ncbi:hypothetical protein ACWEWU_03035 [Staphylococcus xylosus]